jgi:4-hydroxybenzoyl-CoA thioesterase
VQPFEHRQRVRFQDVDAAGILFFSRYFEYAHAAYEEWLRLAGAPIEELIGLPEAGAPLVAAAGEFHAPARLGELLAVRCELESLGSTSARFVFHFAAAASGERRASVRTTHVCVDRRSFRPRPWPERLRSLFEAAAAEGADPASARGGE